MKRTEHADLGNLVHRFFQIASVHKQHYAPHHNQLAHLSDNRTTRELWSQNHRNPFFIISPNFKKKPRNLRKFWLLLAYLSYILVKDPKSGMRTLSSFFSAPAKYDKPPNFWDQKSIMSRESRWCGWTLQINITGTYLIELGFCRD